MKALKFSRVNFTVLYFAAIAVSITLSGCCSVFHWPWCPKTVPPTPQSPAVQLPLIFKGNVHWTVPTGVTHIFVAAWGGGGGGGSGDDAPNGPGFGGVGGYGSIANFASTDVEAKQEYVIEIGIGGKGGTANGHSGVGQPGTDSKIGLIGEIPVLIGHGAPGGEILNQQYEGGEEAYPLPPHREGFTTPGRGFWNGNHNGRPGDNAPTLPKPIPGISPALGGGGGVLGSGRNDNYGACGGGGGAGFEAGGIGGLGGANAGSQGTAYQHNGKPGAAGGIGAGGGGGGGGGDAGGVHGNGGDGGPGVVVIWWDVPAPTVAK